MPTDTSAAIVKHISHSTVCQKCPQSSQVWEESSNTQQQQNIGPRDHKIPSSCQSVAKLYLITYSSTVIPIAIHHYLQSVHSVIISRKKVRKEKKSKDSRLRIVNLAQSFHCHQIFRQNGMTIFPVLYSPWWGQSWFDLRSTSSQAGDSQIKPGPKPPKRGLCR